ncbi:hemicentin-2-like isoform X1 [Montipora foliosa]|uniref:hemicentin-2-like isoform X1 n=1 Tax=Montipora foliosa TaxID=591990 RepID=UPI0035F18C3F
MSSMYFTFATLLCICGFQYTECAPWFTQEPNNGNDYYVLNGTNTLSLIWDYNSDGESVREVSLSYFDESTGSDVYVAAKFGSSALIVYDSYTGRVQFFARATFTIDKIIPSDSRQFKCLVNFNMPPVNPGIPPGMASAVRVVVVVRPSITLKSSTLELNEGETRTLLCVATGNPKPSYKWEKDGAVLQQGTTSNYTIRSAKKEDRGSYTCTAEVYAPGLGTYSDNYTVNVEVKFAPQVTTLSSNQTLNDGNDATFSCTAEAYPMPITYNWFKNVTKISSSAEFVINDVGSRSVLTLKKISKSSADRYSCSGTNSVGEGQKKSVFLNVRYAPQAVTVTATPPEVKEGQSVTLTCQSDGFPSPSFSWRFNGNTINGALKNDFFLANAEVKDAGNYTCVATNIRGSKQFTRMVNVRYKPTKTTFTTGNVRNTAVQGSTVTLTCIANGFPAPKYIIRRNGTRVIQSGGKYIITNIKLNAEYDTYSCHSFNDEGPGTNETLTITVEIPPRFPATSLSSLNKTENETHTFSCTAEAKPAATMRWMLNSENITRVPPYNISTLVKPIPNSKLLKTLSYLTITRITWRQKGLYSCIAHNSAGQQRQSAELRVQYRPVVQFPKDHPQNHTVAVGETVTFYCKTIGNPPTKRLKWQFNGVDIPGESCDNGCSSIQYTKNAVVHQDAGQYSCIGYNDLGYGPPATAELFVKLETEMVQLVPSETTACLGDSITFNCSANSNPAVHTYQLYLNGMMVNETSTTGVWKRTMTTRGEFVYKCMVNNTVGTAMSTNITSTVNVPSFIQPIDDEMIIEGGNVNLTCNASGFPTPTVFWVKTSNGERTNRTELVFTNISRDQAGEYRCEASNLCNTATELATVDVQFQPVITHISAPQTVNRGNVVTLNCTADGKPAASVRWTKLSDNSDVNMPLAISGKEDEGIYRCTASNGIGSVVTRDTSIVLNFAAVIVPLVDRIIVEKGDDVTLFCNASGMPPPTVMWTYVPKGRKQYSETWLITDIQVSNLGEYRCDANNAYGHATDSVTIEFEGRFSLHWLGMRIKNHSV